MKKIALILTLLIANILFAEGFKGFNNLPKQTFLKPSEAFKVDAKSTSSGVQININLADKIHIYKNKLTAKIVEPIKKDIKLNLPKGKIITGEEAYEGNLTLNIPSKELTNGAFVLKVGLSGCSDAGICYAPQSYTFNLNNKANSQSTQTKESFFDKIKALAKNGNSKDIATALENEGLIFVLLLFFIVGLLLALTPCILPMIPILSSILIQQANKSQDGVSKKSSSFAISLVYVVAMALTYALIGIIAGLLHFDLQANLNNLWVIIPVAAIFVALAFSLFGYFELALPSSLQTKLNNISNSAQGNGYLGTAVMGSISALIVGACTAPVISGAILFISITGNALLGGLALFVMGMGAGVPLLLVGLGANKFVPKPGTWMENVSRFFGVLMLIMALYIARGVISPTLFIYLFAIILIGTALGFGVFSSKEAKGFGLVFRTFNFLILIYGSILFIGALSGSTSILNPLERFTGTKSQIVNSDTKSEKSYTLAQLLAEVKNAKKPVVVDIGKDNCAACTELNEITFPNPKVQEEMKRFKFIQLNISKYTKDDQEILKHFNIFGAPNVLFFNSKGEAEDSKFQQGFVKPERFVEILKTIK